MKTKRRACILALFCVVAGLAGVAPAVELVRDDPATMARLEREGAEFLQQVGPRAIPAIASRIALERARLEARVAVKVAAFDAGWLEDGAHHFALIAAVERPDRDESRLIYRLVDAREAFLPMTVNLVLTRNRPQAGVRRLEVNVQLARLLDDGKDRFLDQTHYLLLSFVRTTAGAWVAERLENEPDVARLVKDQRLRQKLLTWLSSPAQQAAIETGTHRVPHEFLADAAVSVTPLGLRRLANAPFRAVFSRGELPAATMRKLDAATCVGCHQSRSIAGFHLLGVPRVRPPAFDALRDGRSPFFSAIQAWRREYVPGREPPDPERLDGYDGEGASCGPGWSCGPGLACRSDLLDGADGAGSCAPEAARDGGVCDRVAYRTESDPVLDVWRQRPPASCPNGGVCATTRNGFPQGLCATPCGEGRTASASGAALCLPVPTLGGFSVCLEGGGAFAGCLADHSIPMTMPRCTQNRDCRPDFVCVESATGGEDGICAPPYFLPQLSVEHRQAAASR